MKDKIKIEVISDLSNCKKIWNTYSKKRTIWDLWEIRKILIDVYKFPLHFVVGTVKGEIKGVLPLWYNKILNQFEWITDGWIERNYAFGNDRDVISVLLKNIKGKISLEAISPDDIDLFDKSIIKSDSDHYGLDIGEIKNSWDGFLLSLPRKKRQNINRDIRSIFQMNPVIRYDLANDLQKLFDLSVLRMRQKVKKHDDEEISVYETPESDIYKSFIKELWNRKGNEYNARIISVTIKNKIVSCDFNLVYKNQYYPLHSGIDVDSASGIGTFANMLDIKDAINYKCNYVDFCMEDHHWKHTWFKSDPMFKIEIQN